MFVTVRYLNPFARQILHEFLLRVWKVLNRYNFEWIFACIWNETNRYHIRRRKKWH